MSDQLGIFYNTTHLDGADLAEAERVTGAQNLAVLAFFRAHPTDLYAPHEVQVHALPTAPITSVRRAITTLERRGFLEKTRTMRPGPFGRAAHCWRLLP